MIKNLKINTDILVGNMEEMINIEGNSFASFLFAYFCLHLGKESTCQCRKHRRLRFDPWGWEYSLE